jgi:hypothetical protein
LVGIIKYHLELRFEMEQVGLAVEVADDEVDRATREHDI